MGLKLKDGKQITRSTENLGDGNVTDWEGVKKDGGAINPYGVNRNDLSLNPFEGEQDQNRQVLKDENIEIKLNGDDDFKLDDRLGEEKDNLLAKNSISQAIDHRTYTSDVEREGPLQMIMMIIAYVAIIVKLSCMGWICSQHAVDIVYNVQPLQWVVNVVAVVIVIDAIVVNVLHKRSISLIVFALLLDCLYPLQRGKRTEQGETIGTILTVIMFIAYGALFLQAGKAVNNYGTIIYLEDEKTREEIAFVLDQEINNARLGNRIMQIMDIEEAIYGQENKKDVVILEGKGSVHLQNSSFVANGYKDTETRLGFVKSDTGQYELVSVTLGDQVLTDQYLEYYQKEVLE